MYSPKNTVLQQQQLNKSSHPCGLMSMLSSLYAYITREYSPQALPRNTAPAPLTVQFTKAKTPSSVADCLRWAAIAYDCPTTERVQSCCSQFSKSRICSIDAKTHSFPSKMEKKTAMAAGALLYLTFSFVASLNVDESSLLAIKSQIDSEILSKNWSQHTSFCNWIGVSCSRRRRRVAALDLSGMGLRGGVGREIGNLSFLTFLNINNNALTGPIPEEMGKLRRLRVLNMAMNELSDGIPQTLGLLRNLRGLNLSNNYLSGNIPQNLSASQHLIELDLSSNNLAGNIPSDLGNLSQLQLLLLFDNQLTGTLPPSIGNLSKLVIIDISRNSFHGTIPSEIGTLSTLRFLSLELNHLNGEVPHSIFNLSALQLLALASNNLSGTLPFSTHQLGLPNIQEIFLDLNQFHGSIPNSISNLSHLSWLDLSSNSFTGLVPTTLGNLHQLKYLNLAGNQLMNNISNPDQDFLSSLTACNYLSHLDVSVNPITGALTLGVANLSASLETFLGYQCSLTGLIPDEIGNLSKLIWLDLRINGLSGVVPTSFKHLSNLQKLDLSFNQLHGSISHFVCDLKNLYSIRLIRNNFSGDLPSCLGGLPLLGDIYFSDNAFTSNIPSTLWSAKNVQNLILFNNFFDGSLPQEVGNLKSLVEFDVSGNQLSGQIPVTISQLQNLIFFSLSNNKFDGIIPDCFAGMSILQHLDLSQNNLSGPIPNSLETLLSLNYFNVSFNNLSGEIPDINFTAQSFAGNKGLCGAPRFKVELCRRSKNKTTMKLHIIAPVIVAAAFILVTVIIYYGRNSNSPTPSSPTLPLVPTLKRISHREILEATRNFHEQNLIGRGGISSVYKATFSDATVAAVKVFNLETQGAFKSFDVECQVLSSVRHRNLVEVITSCSNLDFKAVLMAYMSNGNLERWLYSADFSLNLVERVGIMVDVASALEYLHQWHTFPIVHCDIKPSNILLDEDMVAHVADFGITKLLTEEHRMQLTTTLGTIGYMAPEYGSEGIVSSMVDVYSYGVLVMEILVRRKPTDAMFSGEFNMKRLVSESFPDSVMEIVDDDLINMDDRSVRGRHERCLISCIEVALECAAEVAEERPEMKDVAARMRKIKLSLLASN